MRKFLFLLRRKTLGFESEGLEFEPVGTENIPSVLAAPISAGLCAYGEVYLLSLEDFYNMIEILQVRSENERRSYEAIQKKSKEK
jgi:hypothetical protein